MASLVLTTLCQGGPKKNYTCWFVFYKYVYLFLISLFFNLIKLMYTKISAFLVVQELKKEMDIMVKKIDLLEVHQRFVSHYFYGYILSILYEDNLF